MAEATALRISPRLSVPGEEELLPYAPPPWILKKCAETDIIFLSNPPAYEELSETYAYEVTFARESQARQQAEPLRYAISTGLKRFRSKVLKRNKILGMLRQQIGSSTSQPVNVLDIGCGWGELLENLMLSLPADMRQRCAPHGVEISRELSRLSDQKLRPFGGRCVHAPAHEGIVRFGKDYFDVIVMASYLEHESQPLAVLESSRTSLRPGGAILVKVPNFASFNRMLRGARWCGFRWPEHVNYFTPKTLKAMAHKAGLKVLRMTALDRNPLSDNMYAVLQRRDQA
jgi:2-polyprenyl-3-methyl-5-hydroxy-6-metoxy-1,4-benzoquinol methylase